MSDGITFITQPGDASVALGALAPPVARWFSQRFGAPTPVQRLAWSDLEGDGHLLLSAPTGTGKTLAALLPILGGLMRETAAEGGRSIRCVYVAPLRALVNDATRNVRSHAEEIAAQAPGEARPLRLAVRHGDSSQVERRRVLTEPPDLLFTTPESLALLLTLPASANLFARLGWVVVDEVHALASTKRGADLALSLERLSALSEQPVRRVGLSATATPLPEAARYLAGAGRACRIAAVSEATPLRLTYAPLHGRGHFLAELVARLEPELRARRSTLIFTNTRGLAERLAWALRRLMPDWEECIAVHHSALAAGRRRQVEEAFKEGQLRAVVCSTSLELGIDIGEVDLAVLVHPPGDVVRLLQRVGRAGHGPGRIKHGLVLTATPAELLEAVVTGASGQSAQCEPLRVPDRPLDVLCQQLLGLAAAGPWDAEQTYALVRRAYPYRDLDRRDFDDCMSYLRGLRRDGEPWLPARLRREANRYAVSDQRTVRLLRLNLGTILAEEVVPVVLQDLPGLPPGEGQGGRDRVIGQLDRAYAERLEPGHRFLLDGRCLECRRAEGTAVVVSEVLGRPSVPRWGGDGWPLSTELARRLYLLRTRAADALRDGPAALAELLRREYGLEDRAVDALTDYFQRQDCVSEIPDSRTVLVEGQRTSSGENYYAHTPLNRLANDALARVAVLRLARDHGRAASSIVADLGFVLQVPGTIAGFPALLRSLLDLGGFEADLDRALAESPALRERFRRVALTGLMLLRNPLGRRRRVGGDEWAGRHLFDRLRASDPDFVLLRQAAREVRADWCDCTTALDYAAELPAYSIRCRWIAGISPFVESWTQTDIGPAEEVETPAEVLRRLHEVLTGSGGGDAGSR
jgi:ATP-dependent Lhr-like helicase